jgi:hypothetical protein
METNGIFESILKVPIPSTYDPHQWQTSEDPWTHTICAQHLCQPCDKNIPSRGAVEEAFDAIDKLFN